MKPNTLLLLVLFVLFSCFQPILPVKGYLPFDDSGNILTASDACTGVVKNTPFFTFAYGTVSLNGSSAPAGTVVQAKSPRGDVVGCFVITSSGNYGAMYIYGEDTSVTPAIPGMRAGETVSFLVNTVSATTSPSLTWQNDKEVRSINLSATFTVNANFSADKTTGQAPLAVQFTDTSTPTPTSWSWTFGDGGTSSLQNPLHTYTSPGTYSVSLSVTSSHGSDTETKTSYITVTETITANFSANVTSGSAPLTVQFSNTSSGSYSNSSWTFGDGGTSTLTNPSYTYNTPGAYTVSLTVSGPGGSDSETKTGYITVSSTIEAQFHSDKTAGPAPLSVQFTNDSTGNFISSSWNFGDSTTSASTHPLHTYTNPGKYSVSLSVTGSSGTDTETKTEYITVYTPVTAAFQADVRTGPAPLTVQFSNLSIGDYTTSSWDFGDNGISTQKNPSYTYTKAGSYNVTLTVSGPGGTNTKTESQYITVHETVAAEFHANKTSGAAPLLVSFTNDSTGNYTSSLWNFGDNTTSNQTNPAHSYTNPGTYSVTLTVSGPGGTDVETKTGYIQVYTTPVADFLGTPTSGDVPLTVQFTNISTGTYETVQWNFGDSTPPVTDDHPSHTYTEPGTYTVSLTLNGPAGSDTETKTNYVTVNPNGDIPFANFAVDRTSGQSPLLVQFTNQSVGTGSLSYLWDFGDGSPTSTATNPSHIFLSSSERNFTVKLTVTANGKSSTKEMTITVLPNFIYLPITIC